MMLVWLTSAGLFGAVLTFLLMSRIPGHAASHLSPDAGKTAQKPVNCEYTVVRVPGFQRIQPVLYSEPMCESERFQGMRNEIGALIERLKASGQVSSMSVYVRDFEKAEWTWCNGDERYDPGPMRKFPLLLAWLSMIDEDPAVMVKTWTCSAAEAATEQSAMVHSDMVLAGHSYSTAQLIERMVERSDDRAAAVLYDHLPTERYTRTLKDLGLPVPASSGEPFRLNVRDYSIFMKALYNSSFLSPSRSEYALELLTRCTFEQGLAAGVPEGVEIAHKFAEAHGMDGKELHETGIVFMEGYPYLITVMTRGARVDSLASAIADVSRLVYARIRPEQ